MRSFDKISTDTLTRHTADTSLASAKVATTDEGSNPFLDEVESAGNDPEGFWADKAERLVSWYSPWEKVVTSKEAGPEVRWFPGAKLNVAYNCLDRHIKSGRRNTAALIWQGEEEADVRVYTYQMLHSEVCRFANVLKTHGVKRGDRVALYMPMIPELAVAMLACARIGAVHCVIFAGFSAESLRRKIQDCSAKVLVTADNLVRAGRSLPLKINADQALSTCSSIGSCIVVSRAGSEIPMLTGRDFWYHEEMQAVGSESPCSPQEMEATDPLFILYTSGSTGEPKGVVHSTGGYLVYALYSCRCVFDLNAHDIHWCTADLGWITGHTYLLYGPLGLGVTSLMFEGPPLYPGPDRYWRIVEKFGVNVFYTSPTVIRALMRYGNEPADIHDLGSLRVLGSVGEPISPAVWQWYHEVIGRRMAPVVDTWWQTETGGIVIAPQPYNVACSPGAAMTALPGVDVAVVDEKGRETAAGAEGRLVIRKPWPGMLSDLYRDAEKLNDTYYARFPGMFDTGDRVRKGVDGALQVTGRQEDVINVSGQQLGTAEIEAALISHPAVAEVAVVARSHSCKGEAVYAYVVLKEQSQNEQGLRDELRLHVESCIGTPAAPEVIQFTPQLPKTKSGKIIRRLLRIVASGDFASIGDTSVLADPSVIETLIGRRSFSD